MHELGLALEVVDMVLARTAGERVARVEVHVGALTAVLPDALAFAFEIACDGTPLAGARLDVRELPARARCRACSAELGLTRPYGRCGCGSTDLDFVSGHELRIHQVELTPLPGAPAGTPRHEEAP